MRTLNTSRRLSSLACSAASRASVSLILASVWASWSEIDLYSASAASRFSWITRSFSKTLPMTASASFFFCSCSAICCCTSASWFCKSSSSAKDAKHGLSKADMTMAATYFFCFVNVTIPYTFIYRFNEIVLPIAPMTMLRSRRTPPI